MTLSTQNEGSSIGLQLLNLEKFHSTHRLTNSSWSREIHFQWQRQPRRKTIFRDVEIGNKFQHQRNPKNYSAKEGLAKYFRKLSGHREHSQYGRLKLKEWLWLPLPFHVSSMFPHTASSLILVQFPSVFIRKQMLSRRWFLEQWVRGTWCHWDTCTHQLILS